MPLFSIVAPFLNEQESAERFAAFADRLAKEIVSRYGFDLEVVLVDDGSTDDSIDRYREHLKGNWRILELSRNFGKEIALYAGLAETRGDYVMMIDADLQHPYDVCLQMIDELLADPKLDVVYTIRDDRNEESLKKALAGRFFYWMINFRQRYEVPENAGDFRVMNRAAVDALLRVRDKRRFNKGLYAWAGFRQKGIYYRPDPRLSGVTKWSRLGLIALSVEGIVSFSALPLRIMSMVGVLTGLAGIVYGTHIILSSLFFGTDVPGYPSLMSAISVLGGFNLALLGLLGEYIWVTIAEVKDRPLYIVRKVHRSGDPS
ncbi:glycosyltransferase family 2 protein [Rhizobium sp. C1]|uniref:glycosyltransferase family 2 protein n=1 Tax=Rhizobium sp. C1 TaxID=1349799 RepID=UPI001E626740|nr:glycosyltransferase family 2 protein [Rhizobium sp. C1]MCD2176687.1 glycosyltransferase family 2 protein [Rhizobium sp. C1]